MQNLGRQILLGRTHSRNLVSATRLHLERNSSKIGHYYFWLSLGLISFGGCCINEKKWSLELVKNGTILMHIFPKLLSWLLKLFLFFVVCVRVCVCVVFCGVLVCLVLFLFLFLFLNVLAEKERKSGKRNPKKPLEISLIIFYIKWNYFKQRKVS